MSEPLAKVTVSIVVVAYRQRDALAECLDSCLAASGCVPRGAELIVVDNGGLADFVRERAPQALVIEPGRNLGFAGGVNRGLRAAQGAWAALVNDDARLQAEALARMLESAAAEPDIGSVAAQVRFHSDPARVNSAGIDVDSLGIATERLAGRSIEQAERPEEVFGASGCVALYRMAMLHELGGLDERFFAYLEDVDLAWRARAAGWRCVYEPRAVAYHHGSASSGEGSRRKYFLVGRNRARLLARNATTGQLLRVLPGIVLYDSAYVLYAAVTDRTFAPLRGRIAGLCQWRAARRETRESRRAVTLSSARHGWMAALRQHGAYLKFGSSS